MNQIPPNADKVADIIKVLNSGIGFYQRGIAQVQGAATRAIFHRMLEEKQQAVKTLQPHVHQEHSDQTDWTVGLRKMYTDLTKNLSATNDPAFTDQLHTVEYKILTLIDDALDEQPPQAFACELRCIRSRMQQCLDEMRSLQRAHAC